MFKRLFSLILSALCAVSMMLPAFAAEDEPVRIRMIASTLNMVEGDTRQLAVTFSPEGASVPYDWSSANPYIATVSGDGLVTAKNAGKTTIYASTGSGVTTFCNVNVRTDGDIAVERLEMNMSQVSVRPGQSRLLWVRALPSYHTDESILWSSSNPKVATIDGDGTLTGVAPGTATITAMAQSGEKARCTVTVSNNFIRDGSTDTTLDDEPPRALLPGQVDTRIDTQSEEALTVTKRFTKFFANPLAVLDCAHDGAFGKTVQLSAKVDLGSAQASNLRFYLYNAESNQYFPLTVSDVRLQNNTLTFSTATGGIILVTDGELTRK